MDAFDWSKVEIIASDWSTVKIMPLDGLYSHWALVRRCPRGDAGGVRGGLL